MMIFQMLEEEKGGGTEKESQTKYLFLKILSICPPLRAAHTATRWRPLGALIASISLTALAETKDVKKKTTKQTPSGFMARYKLTEPLSFFPPPPLPFVLTSSSHITDRFLSGVDEKLRWGFFFF